MNVEKQVIGSCFQFEKCLDLAVERLSKKHFQHFAPVWECITEFYKKGRDHEDILFDVRAMMKDRDLDFYNFPGHASPSINEQVETLIERHDRKVVHEVSEELYRASKDEPDFKREVMKAIHELSDLLSGESKRQQTMAEVMHDTLSMIDRLREGEKLGFETGLDIDRITQGMQKGQFYILAARPSMGKTALAVQIAQRVSIQAPVGFLSLETTNKSLGLRHLANHARVHGEKIRGGYVNDSDYMKIQESAVRLSEMNIITDDTTDITSESIRAKINAMKRKYGIEFLVIDYVQLMKSDKDVREQQVADISRTCVSVAKEFDICVLGLAQLNRNNEARGDKRPMLSDLRESGQLEQDAFCVMLLHRPEYYGVTTSGNGESTAGIAEVIVAKHKDGKTGIKKLHYEKETMRFENLAYETTPF